LPVISQFLIEGAAVLPHQTPPPPLPLAELPLIAQFVIEGEEELQRTPPPLIPAEFPVIAQFVIEEEKEDPSLETPPP
jgi:hypothetical protein